MAIGLIGRTSFICDVVLENPLVGQGRVSSTAPMIVHIAGEEYLWSQIDIRPSSIPLDFYPVTQGRCHCHGPARSTVFWDVLILLYGKEICSIHISPPKISWQLLPRKFSHLTYHSGSKLHPHCKAKSNHK